MKAIEIMELLSYPKGQKLYLQPYEKEFIRIKAKKEKINQEEMEKLKEILKKDKYSPLEEEDAPLDTTIVYNLSNKKKMSLRELSRLTSYSLKNIDNKIKNKICIGKQPYAYDDNDTNLLFYKIANSNKRFVLYRCKELNLALTEKEWRKYFNDKYLRLSYFRNKKYKKEYTFEGSNLYIDYLQYLDYINKGGVNEEKRNLY